MNDTVPTLGQVRVWQPWKITESGHEIHARNTDFAGFSERMNTHIRDAGGNWDGDAYWAAYDRISGDFDVARKVAQEVGEVADAMIRAGTTIGNYRDVLLGKVADATEAGFVVGDDWQVSGGGTDSGGGDSDLHQHQTAVTTALNEMLNARTQVMASISQAADEVRSCGEQFGPGDAIGDESEGPLYQQQPSDDAARTTAAAAEFRKVFGRDPVSNVDWETAMVLNPNSYDPKYQGVDAEVRVARIEPVPGQGVVRTAQWIEQEKVFNVPKDLGDNRTCDPNFDPEHARVTTYIDYENGIVVIRQNPSVSEDGEVDVSAPEAEVWQADDGSVRVKYDAGNPHSPDPTGKWTVNGDLVFVPGHGEPESPGSTGVTVHGTRTDYPSLEVYQEYQNGHINDVAIDPAVTGGEHGPLVNLPFHHTIPGSDPDIFDKFKYIQEYPGDQPPGFPNIFEFPGTSVGDAENPPVVRTLTPADRPLA
ncbi:hypothetical protein [Nocardia cyriacigeorgica]|uniref:hypothetical protein n=1 Tax=Nocardia cyriacigeorgica TaxID=135487 RepID=UPI00055FB87A|nr:hypothetical protein [Nocardia cyriacigeorgica]TLF60792.1 hypothetical protein FEK31_03570 [Nocardia cyriacigeorgica]